MRVAREVLRGDRKDQYKTLITWLRSRGEGEYRRPSAIHRVARQLLRSEVLHLKLGEVEELIWQNSLWLD